MNDLAVPNNGKDRSAVQFDFWPHLGTAEWIQYQFVKPSEVKTCTVWWFDDTGYGACRIPASWRIVYRTANGQWKPVEGVKDYPVAKGVPVTVTFTPVTTASLRLEIQLPAKFSSGVYEWEVR